MSDSLLTDMSDSLLTDLLNAYDYFEICRKYNNLIQKYKNDIRACEEKYFQLKNVKVSHTRVIIALVICLLVFMVFISSISVDIKIALFTILIFAVAVLGLIVSYFKYTKRKKQNIKNADDFWKSTASPICTEDNDNIQKLNSELKKFCGDNKDLISFLPPDYQNISAVAYMTNAVKNYRADTLKEAINLYVEQLHRWQLEKSAEETCYQQRLLLDQVNDLYQEQLDTNTHLRNLETLEMFDLLIKSR